MRWRKQVRDRQTDTDTLNETEMKRMMRKEVETISEGERERERNIERGGVRMSEKVGGNVNHVRIDRQAFARLTSTEKPGFQNYLS